MKLKELIEKKNAKIEEMNGILSKMDTENRSEMAEDEKTAFDKLETEVRSLEDTIKRVETASGLEKKTPVGGKKDDTEERAAQEEAVFADYIRGVISENRADVNMTVADGTATIPATIANKIIKKVYDICPIYQMATRYNIKGTLSIPYYDEDTQKITMAYASEFTELESTSGKFTSMELTGFLAGVLSKISVSLVNNSQFDITSFVVSQMAEDISKWIEKELINGTDNKIEGLRGVTQKVTAAAATAITLDELIDTQETVLDQYQAGAVWIMNKKTRTAIRKFKNSQGDYILNQDATARWGYTLFGKDVYTTDSISEMAAGKTAVFYGDMTGLAVKLSEEVNIQVLREKFATQHAIGVVGWIEIDSKVENAQKIAKLEMAKS
ncbi:phage major capsid protein, HK97 family [Clostridium sp. ASBs410]|nr:phage major capsid protein, HK97 family [Clostridium sp. ASBs410]